MALTILTIACFLFYASSKYFPDHGIALLQWKQKTLILIASALALLSLFIMDSTDGFATAFTVWLVAFMTLLSAVIISIKLSLKWTWVWAGVCLVFILTDLL